jgi:DNA damage-binding protein 1
MLLLDYEESMNNACKVTQLQLELLGETSVADNISYIDNGVVFIGSKVGDSQLIKVGIVLIFYFLVLKKYNF